MQLFVGKWRLSSYAPLSVDVLTIFAAAQRTPFAVAKDQDTQKVQSQLVDEDSWLLWTGDDWAGTIYKFNRYRQVFVAQLLNVSGKP